MSTSMIWLTYVALIAVPFVALATSIFNLATWPRGSAGRPEDETSDGAASSPSRAEDVSVLVPARNEAETIESCIRAIYDGETVPGEVVVYDDRSEDDTGRILDRLQNEFPTLRVLDGEPLPDGWIGKPHACWHLSRAATGERLVFVDADTSMRPRGLTRLLSLLDEGPADRADLVTAVPRQEFGSWGEALVVPLLHMTYTSWLPLALIWRTSDPRFVAANGQLVATRADALASVGGFRAVRSDVVDDVALARRFKERNRDVVFADGSEIADCRMYDSWAGVWKGFSKNLYEGIGGNSTALAGVVALYAAAFLVPWFAAPLAWAVGWPHVAAAALIGIGCNLLLRTLLAWRFHHPASAVLLHPVGVALLIAIAFNSYGWSRRNRVRWAGRTYAARHNRRRTDENDNPKCSRRLP